MSPPAHRRHAVDTVVQEGTVLGDGHRDGTGLSHPGRGCHRVGGRGAPEPPGRRIGVSPSLRSRSSLSARSARRRGGSQTRREERHESGGRVRPRGLTRGFRGNSGRNARKIRRPSSAAAAGVLPLRRCLSPGLARAFSARRVVASAPCGNRAAAVKPAALMRSA